MEAIFTLDNLLTLGMLIMLQAVLGFDNLLYISLESKRVAPEQQGKVRKNRYWCCDDPSDRSTFCPGVGDRIIPRTPIQHSPW